MNTPNNKTFHLGLCMAGSISAGAYTAGVVDYLIEALENWEKAKVNEPDTPQHQVVIDLLCGASGGGITGAITQFALMDTMDHGKLNDDGVGYTKPVNNILWDSWVELSGGDVFGQILATNDIGDHDIRSVLNATFIDTIAGNLNEYILKLAAKNTVLPPFAGKAPEMFMTLFNITGINYELHSKAATGASAGVQYVSDHRDIAHFRWTEGPYEDDGRMPVSLKNLEYLPVILDAAKATGAFPIGLKARMLTRKAKYIWDNPFFNRGKEFDKATIFLGKEITANDPEKNYTSINADGGTANNEPVELARDILLNMRDKKYNDVSLTKTVGTMTDLEKTEAKKEFLMNTSILLIDPFPSSANNINTPDCNSDILLKYIPSMVNAMNSQLIFDAKDALDAYKKENYGLHIISPARKEVHASKAIACGSLGGFGGFLDREFRVHDFFLGRHNCQSFLRKYFVVNLNEPNPENRECMQAIIDSYNENPTAIKRFAFTDENGLKLVPVIPDTSLRKPITLTVKDEALEYIEEAKLPNYRLKKLAPDFLDKYSKGIAGRYMSLCNNLFKTSFLMGLIIKLRSSVLFLVAVFMILYSCGPEKKCLEDGFYVFKFGKIDTTRPDLEIRGDRYTFFRKGEWHEEGKFERLNNCNYNFITEKAVFDSAISNNRMPGNKQKWTITSSINDTFDFKFIAEDQRGNGRVVRIRKK